MNKVRISAIFAVLLIGLVAACNKVPTKELEDARTAIERAASVQADVFATPEFTQAVDSYTQATNLVSEKKNKEAKQLAIASASQANASYNTAVKKRAEDIVEKDKFLLDSAAQFFAATIVPDDYAKAKTDMDSLVTVFNSGDYLKTYTDGTNLQAFLNGIVDTCKTKVEKVKNTISDAQDQYDRAENKDIVRKYAYEDLKLALPYLENARKSFESGNLDDALTNANQAIDLIAAAVKKAEDAFQKELEERRHQQEILDMQRQQELEAERQRAQENLNRVQQMLDRLHGNMPASTTTTTVPAANGTSGSLPNPELNEFGAAPSGAFSALGVFVIDDNPSTNAAVQSNNTVDDEDVTVEMVEYYYQLAQDSYAKGEYLDSIDYSREALRLGEILLARQSSTTYTVVNNPANRDCLWKIAGKMYNNSNTWMWPIIWRANKYQIQDPDLIFPGQVFVIPPSILGQ